MMNTKHLAEYIIENSHEDADAKIVAQAYLGLLKEMEGGWMKMPGLWSYRTGCLMFRWKWIRDLYDYCKRKTND